MTQKAKNIESAKTVKNQGFQKVDEMSLFSTLSSLKPGESTKLSDHAVKDDIAAYDKLSENHPDAVLLMRSGSYYVAYRDSAAQIAKRVGTTPIECNGVKGCRFSAQSLDSYLPRLVRAGLRVAIGENLEEPAKKAVKKASKKAAKKVVEPAAPQVEPIKVVDYSDRAFALTGGTQAVKALLKQLGGRYNPKLTCGKGWIFSKKRAAQVAAALSIQVAF